MGEQQQPRAAEKENALDSTRAEPDETQESKERSREAVESRGLEDQPSPQEANPDADRMARKQSQGETVRQQR